MRGSIAPKKKVGNIGATRDRYEYTRRSYYEKAQMNLDKIFIAKFKNIKIREICKKHNINVSKAHLLNLNARDIHIIKVEIDRMIREMYNIDNYKDYDLSKTYLYHRYDKRRNQLMDEGKIIKLAKSTYDELTDE